MKAIKTAKTLKKRFYISTIEEHYKKNHSPLSFERTWAPPYTDTSAIEKISLTIHHREPKNFQDKIAYNTMLILRQIVHLVFKNKYGHHAVVLETVASIPGFVGAMLRHFRSLRRMHRDYGWISKLLEDAENERMHLLVWISYVSPTFFERILVTTAQLLFTPFYTFLYFVSPSTAHRLVGYLEEEAVLQYTEFLKAIDDGKIKNIDAPEIAIKYWNLPPDAKLRDVVLCVRADEAHHRDQNHVFGDDYLKTFQ